MRTWGALWIAAVVLGAWSAVALAQEIAPVGPEPTPFRGDVPQAPPPPAPPAAAAPAPAVVAAPIAPAPPGRPARVPLVRRWYFWAGLGVAAVGVVVAGILLSPPQPYAGNAEPGITSPF